MIIVFEAVKILICLSRKGTKKVKSRGPPKKPINRRRALGGGWGGGGPNPSLPPNVVPHTIILVPQNNILDCRKEHSENNCLQKSVEKNAT